MGGSLDPSAAAETPDPSSDETPEQIDADIRMVGALNIVPALLEVLCR